MELYVYTFGSVLIVSFVSLIGVFALSINRVILSKSLLILVGVAAGALVGDAVIHLIPEALEGIGSERGFGIAVLAGIVIFFALERYLRWHHAHHASEEEHEGHERFEENGHNPVPHLAPLVLIADGLHNLIDGAIIAASFLVSIELGIATTIAVLLHEIPQEIADFGLLLHAGMSRMRALFFNFLSGLTALFGAGAFFVIGSSVENIAPYAAAFTAGSFLYIAIADIVPELHKSNSLTRTALHVVGFIGGVGIMLLLTFTE